jgi:PIN domain nuclease of toxin-antitoxin system
VRLLLDTHIALWALEDSPALPSAARALIADEANDVVVSVVSLWEIAIKFARRRGRPNDMPMPAAQAAALFSAAGYEVLPVMLAHALEVEGLPPIHGDPFDRLLIAQARSEPLRLLTSDAQLAAYGDAVELV